MKTVAYAFALSLLAGTAFAQSNSGGQGSMAYPAPQGNLTTPKPSVPTTSGATGSAGYPAPVPQGNVSTTVQGVQPPAASTGSMAYPAPLPQGSVPAK